MCLTTRNKAAWTLLGACLYFAASVLGHDLVSQIYAWLVSGIDRQVLERGMTGTSLGLALIALLTMHNKLRSLDGLLLMEFVALTVALLFVDQTLISTNIERLHYPQYAILAAVLWRITPRCLLVVSSCTLFGAIDELVQFVVNPQYTKYLDFNDMVLNLVGALTGVFLMRLLRVPSLDWRPGRVLLRWLNAVLIAAALLLLIVVVVDGRFIYHAVAGDNFTFFRSGRWTFILTFIDLDPFWHTGAALRQYHILRWWECALAMIVIWTPLNMLCQRTCHHDH